MASFCFVSFLQPGHMDFGGQSFVLLAQELINRGHHVTWVFSYSKKHDFSEYAHKILNKAGIEFDKVNRFYLTIYHHNRNIMDSASELCHLIRARHYDCLLVDRLCVGAAFAAAWAGIPWAVVGTDGREWSFVKQGKGHVNLLPTPNETDFFNPTMKQKNQYSVHLSARSYWATSPYLNLTFFPRSYYSESGYADIPLHSHFLGSGLNSNTTSKGDTVLITFGNTFNDIVKRKLISCILEQLEMRNIQALVLTGDNQLNEQLQNEFLQYSCVTFKSWMSYDDAYAKARIAIGHGGTAHVWTGMRNGVPLLVIPSIGDQTYGGQQVERLNIGRVLEISKSTRLIFPLPDFIKHIIYKPPTINFNECILALNQLLDDPDLRKSCKSISEQMQSGGGIQAGASLLEQLASNKTPITKCTSGACCC